MGVGEGWQEGVKILKGFLLPKEKMWYYKEKHNWKINPKKGLLGTHIQYVRTQKGAGRRLRPGGACPLHCWNRYPGEHFLFRSGDVTLKLAFHAQATFQKPLSPSPLELLFSSFFSPGHPRSDIIPISSNVHIFKSCLLWHPAQTRSHSQVPSITSLSLLNAHSAFYQYMGFLWCSCSAL